MYLVGRMGPAGHVFETPDLKYKTFEGMSSKKTDEKK
jgi:hypothetical protein